MSCFIMEPTSIAQIACAAEALLNMGYDYFGMEAPVSMRDALKDCMDNFGHFDRHLIYDRLFELNVRAYCIRYGDKVDKGSSSWPDFSSLSFSPIHRRFQYKDHHMLIRSWHYHLAKKLDCYVYQVSEDGTRGDPLTLAMEEWACDLMRFIVRNNNIYCSASWG